MAHRITEGYARLASGNVAVIGRGGIVTDIIPAAEYANPPGSAAPELQSAPTSDKVKP